jgi:hypothetical protein
MTFPTVIHALQVEVVRVEEPSEQEQDHVEFEVKQESDPGARSRSMQGSASQWEAESWFPSSAS